MTRPVDRRAALGLLLSLAAIGGAGCDRQQIPAPPAVIAPPRSAAPTPPPDPPAAPLVVAAETPYGKRVSSTQTGDSQAPAGLPDDLPLYAHAIPISSMASQSGGTIVNLRSTDGAEQIFVWYRDELPKHGWVLEKQSGAGGQRLVIARKPGRKASVLISASGDPPNATRILLTVLEEP